MIVSLVLSFLHRHAVHRPFVWSPSVDLSDHAIYSTLITHTNY